MTSFLLLLHSGDYLDAHRRREQGEADRYRHHSYALDTLEALQRDGVSVTVVSVFTPSTYDETVGHGLRFVGLGGTEHQAFASLERVVQEVHPSHVMLRYPSVEVLSMLRSGDSRVSVVLADSFPGRLRHWLGHRRLGAALRHPTVDFVANHHLASSRQLVDVLGLDAARVVPWDWPLDLLDAAETAPAGHHAGGGVRLFYAGTLSESKGVLDLLEAVELLAADGTAVTLEVAGAGGDRQVHERLDALETRGLVRRLGRIGGDDIIERMRAADLVCVPSRHEYPEGLPLTIYEAMASGTPLVASDHPMFRDVVRDGETGFVFPAGDAQALARAIRRAYDDPALHDRVAANARAAYPTLGLNTLWGDLVRRWVRGSDEDRAWLRDHSLAGDAGR